MAKFNLFKGDRPSNGARNLKDALPDALMLKSEGSKYRGKIGQVLINWGTKDPHPVFNGAGHTILNRPSAVNIAVMKDRYYQHLWDNENTRQYLTPFTTSWDHALQMIQDGGGRMYARTVLNGHSGNGIHLMVSRSDNDLQAVRQLRDSLQYPVWVHGDARFPRALQSCELFTQGITGKRTEYRIHVFRGRVILTQAKLKREGSGENPNYNSLIRNVASGWVYAVNDVPQAGIERSHQAALAVMAGLGLDFGAVDIIYKHDANRAFAIEVNTAPGLDEDGSALAAYAEAIQEEFQ
jgi:hypothetical protein